MIKKNIVFLLFWLTYFPYSIAQKALDSDQKAIILNNNAFAFDFLRLINQDQKSNFAFSPFSLSVGFSMAYAGSANETEAQMQKCFRFGENHSSFHKNFRAVLQNLQRVKSYELNSSNVAFVERTYKIRNSYQNNLIDMYNAELKLVDFKNASITQPLINEWGDKHSKGLIKEVLSSYNPLMKLLLVNLTFFEATWGHSMKFEKSSTKIDTFYTPQKKILTPFMHKAGFKGQYLADKDWVLVGLPIQEYECSLTILMPQNNYQLDNLISNPPQKVREFLDNNPILDETDDLPTTRLEISLPKFEIDTKIDPSNILQKMGLKDAFSESKADFSNITPHPRGLFISILEHNCRVLVDETGVKAAASTAISFVERGIAMGGKKVEINKPFIFFIRDDVTKCVLFVGKVTNPVVPKN
jgi:serpin B